MRHFRGCPAGESPRFKALDSLTRRVLPVVVSTGLILGNVSVGLVAQEVVQLRESADICRDCIRFETVAVLGGDYDGDNLLTGSVYVNRGASGRIYVHDFGAGGSEMFFYRADGQLEFTIRRSGEGPGEYQRPMPIVELPSGRVAVFDEDNVRVSILERDGTFIESNYFPHRISWALPVSDSVLLVSASIRTPELAGIPFHLVHLRGTILESFGPEASLMPGAEGVGRRHVIVLDDGRFLSTSASGRPYRIELWNGRSIERVWTREAEWFPLRTTRRDDGKVSPHLAGISGDGSHLWTIVPVPDPSWTPSPPGTRIAQSGDALDNRFDTMVEVIDLNTNEIVATQRFDQYVFGLLSGETALRLTADDLGVPLWLIQSLTIRPAGRQR